MIKLLKSGNWALEGVNVVEMVAGNEQSFGPVEDFKLVSAGWAKWVEAAKPEMKSEEAQTEQRRPGRPRNQ